MGHVVVEEMANWNMIMPTVLSVIFGLPLPLHGQTDVTHGPHLMLLVTLSEVDAILLQLDTNLENMQTMNGEFLFPRQNRNLCMP